MELIFASKNLGKIKEVREIFTAEGIQVVSMEEAGVDLDVVEDGTTFEENAVKKAKAVMEATGRPALSDDSGLELDAMGGKPGVYSSRFLGETMPYGEKNQKILKMLENVHGSDRQARYVCVIAAAFPDGRTMTARGEMEGIIAGEPAGSGGFGYDPILFIPEKNKTVAQMADAEKNSISHRGKALQMMKKILMKENRVS